MILKKCTICLLVLLSANQLSFAQNSDGPVLKLSHKLRSGNDRVFTPNRYDGIPDTFKVVAILAQFQEDNSGLTTGNGKFDLSNKYFDPATQRDTVIDSPPYDSAYFADHLEFLKNYYFTVSNGLCIIDYELHSQVLTLPNNMETYAPRQNENLSRLGNLFTDAWTLADNNINFSNYNPQTTAFVIFH